MENAPSVQGPTHELHKALAARLPLATLEEILRKEGCDPNAVYMQHQKILPHLIKKERLPLTMALQHSNPSECIALLCKYGAEVNKCIDTQYARDHSLLKSLVARTCTFDLPSVVRVLLEKGLDICKQDDQGNTILHWAATYTLHNSEAGRYIQKLPQYFKDSHAAIKACLCAYHRNGGTKYMPKPLFKAVLNLAFPGICLFSPQYTTIKNITPAQFIDKKNNYGYAMKDLILIKDII